MDPGTGVKHAARLVRDFGATVVGTCHALPLAADGHDLMTPAAYTRRSGCSTIQRHVDAVWMLRRPEMYDPASPERRNGHPKLRSNRLELPESMVKLQFLAHRVSCT